jgi:hypothetical protein
MMLQADQSKMQQGWKKFFEDRKQHEQQIRKALKGAIPSDPIPSAPKRKIKL